MLDIRVFSVVPSGQDKVACLTFVGVKEDKIFFRGDIPGLKFAEHSGFLGPGCLLGSLHWVQMWSESEDYGGAFESGVIFKCNLFLQV